MTKTQAGSGTPSQDGRVFSEQLHRIRDVHIEVESILQSLAASRDDNPCARCTSVCCKEVYCRESVNSAFLRFVLGPRVDAYSANDGWFEPGSGCRLSYGRPLVCYAFFCEKFELQPWAEPRRLSREFKNLYASALAGQHMLVVDDISRIGENRLNIIHGRLEKVREMASAALCRSLQEKLVLNFHVDKE